MHTPEEFALENGIANLESISLARTKLYDSYNDILRVIKEYMDINEDYAKMIAIWIIGTYFHDCFNAYPYLFLNAMRGSGKTRLLKLISSLGAKGDGSVQNNLTEAVLFRIPKGTVTCIDEVEQIGSKEKQTLRELLNSAYKKGTKVKRMKKIKHKEGEDMITETFEPYIPIAMANIWGVEEVLADRSIVMTLEKSNNQSVTKMIEDFDTNPKIQEIKRTLNLCYVVYVMSLRKKTYIGSWNNYIKSKYNDITTYTYITTITTLTTEEDKRKEIERKNLEIEQDSFFNKIDESNINGRNFELIFPLLLIAKEIDEVIFNEILSIATEIVKGKKEDEYSDSKDVSLFEFISSNEISSYGLNYVALKELTVKFRLFLGDDSEEDRWLNDKWMGRALKRLNLLISRKRVTSGRMVILNYPKALEKLKIFK